MSFVAKGTTVVGVVAVLLVSGLASCQSPEVERAERVTTANQSTAYRASIPEPISSDTVCNVILGWGERRGMPSPSGQYTSLQLTTLDTKMAKPILNRSTRLQASVIEIKELSRDGVRGYSPKLKLVAGVCVVRPYYVRLEVTFDNLGEAESLYLLQQGRFSNIDVEGVISSVTWGVGEPHLKLSNARVVASD